MKRKRIWKLSIYLGLSCLAAFSMSGCVNPAPKHIYHYVKVELVPYYRASKAVPAATLSQNKSGMCRLTCFSHDAQYALYSIRDRYQGKIIYVKGFVNVVGEKDENQICRPENYASSDISKLQTFKDLCRMTVYSCGKQCWAGGNP